MTLNSKFNKTPALAVLMLLGVALPASADTSSDTTWYRDGARWVKAQRIGSPRDGKQEVRLTWSAPPYAPVPRPAGSMQHAGSSRQPASAHAPKPDGAIEGSAAVAGGAAGRSAKGFVGARAILRLSAAVQPAAFLRQHRLKASSPVRQARDERESGVLAARDAVTESPPALNSRLRIYRIESLDGEDGLALAARLSGVAGVEAALPDLYLARRKAADFEVPPNDPRFRGQVYLSRLMIERVWQLTPGNAETTVVVIDDGCDMKHPDLADAMLGGIDVIDEDDDASYSPGVAGNEHGTACAGIIAAVGNNEIGIAGACPRCSLRCVRLFDRNHALIPISADIAAFNYVYDTGAAVVSNSWGFADPQPVVSVLRTAIEELIDQGRGGRGTLVVFAAGNENRLIEDDEIAAIPGVVNVGAVNNFDEAAPFSNSGNSLMITAPTGSLTTDISGSDGADRTDYTSLFGGTSSACPVVAGVGALLMSAIPERSARDIRELLRSSARDAPFADPNASGHDRLYGYGILDPVGAFEAAGLEVPAAPKPRRDAGTPDASEPDAGPAAEGGEDESGCTVARPGRAFRLGPALAIIAAGALLVRRRRRRTQ